MTFDELVDRCKAEIKAERFFDSLASPQNPWKIDRPGFDWGICLFWACVILLVVLEK
jgi:hypothetical protein